jgi:hypothetical protein
MSKLKFYGITGQMYDLIKSYLRYRYQQVVICSDIAHNIYSGWGKVSKGVPQGSILGPFLFLVYIYDLSIFLNKNSLPVLFADDTSVLVTSSNQHAFQVEINEIFTQLYSWFKCNLLSLNLDKTQFIHFKMRNTPYMNTKINNNHNTIFNANVTKFLGLTIENNLSWRTHLDRLSLKLGSYKNC